MATPVPASEFPSGEGTINVLRDDQTIIKEINSSCRHATESLTSDLSKIFEWGRENLVAFNALRFNNFPDNFPRL
ncbi:hypothetical protein E2C01_027537 [Portunus trituberculatus]|uniref:Uncharacterized protein n=1 Tax=Portunus trituberculatus TaxID=210409 RepID=A0A5B7ELK2_PORTR|nr:hypothetical protein [Portunus trituberculatus]